MTTHNFKAPRSPAAKYSYRRLGKAAASFLIVFGISYASILLTLGDYVIAPLWPANAIVLIILLRSPAVKELREDIVASAVMGSILANWLGGHSLPLALWFTAANSAEIFIALTLIRPASRSAQAVQEDSSTLRQFLCFLRTGIASTAAAALVAATGLAVLAGAPFPQAWLDWFSTSALSFLIIVPIGARLHMEDLRQLRTRANLQSAALCAAIVIGLSGFIFSRTTFPLLFLLTPAVLFAAYRHRSLGAAAAVALAAAVATPLTANGYGPLTLFQLHAPKDQQFLLQFFLLTQSLIALTLAAILDDRDSLGRALELKEKASQERAAAQAQLLAHVAHEIRTPLNAILGLGELLQTQEKLSVDGQILVETIVGASAELRTLANDLLDRSKIDAGALRIQPETVALGPLLSELENDLRASENLPRANFDIQIPQDLTVWADRLRTKQIIRNLLINSIKYAHAYGPISVRAKNNSDLVRIEVADRGPGIPAVRQHEIFEPFGGVGSQAAISFSTGFGLSIVRHLAEAQGGAAGFSSTPHIETRFWVDLPAEASNGLASFEDVPEFDVDQIFPR